MAVHLLVPFRMIQVGRYPFGGIFRDGDDSLFFSLAANLKKQIALVKILAVKGDELADSETGAVKKLHNRPVSVAKVTVQIGLVEKLLYLIVAQRKRNFLFDFRAFQLFGGVKMNQPLGKGPLKKGPERGKAPHDGAL